MTKKTVLLLIAITILSLVLRFYRLADRPVSLSIDEVVIGYDAYSILQTGRDQWGQLLPLAFKSVGDYKAPVLIYLMVPFIALLGLTEIAVRFPMALLGSLTPLVVYLLTDIWFKDKKLALLAALSLAISPWHIQFSRASFEAVVGLFLAITGVWLFFRGLKKRRGLWLVAFPIALSAYSYHSERLFVPLLLIALFILFRRVLLKYKNQTIFFFVTLLIITLPLGLLMLKVEGQTRLKSVFITNDYELQILRLATIPKSTFAPAEKLLQTTSFFAKRYLEYADPSYLFTKGMRLAPDKFPDVGLLYVFELPFFLVGLWLLLKNTSPEYRDIKTFLFAWLLLSPIPAALSNNSQHPLRSLVMLPIPSILVAIGAKRFIESKIRFKNITTIGLAVFVAVNIGYYLNLYYIHYPYHFSHFWMYGQKQISKFAWANYDKYDKIIIDPDFGIEGKNITGIPWVYIYFYGQVDPRDIQKVRQTTGSADFAKFEFRSVYWPVDRLTTNYLFVSSLWQLSPKEISADHFVGEVPLYNGQPMFYLVKSDGS